MTWRVLCQGWLRKGQRRVLFRFGLWPRSAYYEIENEPPNGVSKGAITTLTLPRRSAQASVEALTFLYLRNSIDAVKATLLRGQEERQTVKGRKAWIVTKPTSFESGMKERKKAGGASIQNRREKKRNECLESKTTSLRFDVKVVKPIFLMTSTNRLPRVEVLKERRGWVESYWRVECFSEFTNRQEIQKRRYFYYI